MLPRWDMDVNGATAELTRYFAAAQQCDAQLSVQEWWQQQNTLPHLKHVVRGLLTLCASSAAAERAGSILSKLPSSVMHSCRADYLSVSLAGVRWKIPDETKGKKNKINFKLCEA